MAVEVYYGKNLLPSKEFAKFGLKYYNLPPYTHWNHNLRSCIRCVYVSYAMCLRAYSNLLYKTKVWYASLCLSTYTKQSFGYIVMYLILSTCSTYTKQRVDSIIMNNFPYI